jgi:hypothetical protein
VTSFINTFINFDLNVGTSLYPIGGPANDGTGIGSNIEMLTTCDPSGVQTCQIYAGSPTAASNYTVDLGNLAPGTLNASGVTVYHQDGTPGEINYIAFSLSSNAANGTTVAMASQNGALTRAGGAPDNWDIPSGSHGAGVPVVTAPINFTALANSSGKAYGFKFVGTPSYIKIGTGANDPATTMQNVTGCKGTDATYCTLTTAPQTILTTGDTVEGLTATLGLGALANGTNPAGTYTDTLTFIATGTF